MTNIHSFKNKLIKAFQEIDQLKNIQNTILERDYENCPLIFDKINQADKLKSSIENILINLEKPNVLKDIKKKVKKRNLKRLKIKRNNFNKQTKLESRKMLQNTIDQSLEILNHNDLESNARKQNTKFAKNILSNINSKKSDAIKNIKLINSLITFREIKQAKYKLPDPDHDKWHREINQLKAVWADALAEYDEEETKLKQFLSFNSKSLEDRWREVLFGAEIPTKKQNLNHFLEIRRTWDSYIAPNDCKNKSSIPSGWVFPPKEPSELWLEYLFKSGRKVFEQK